MSVLVYIETGKERIRKSSIEAINYAKRLADKMGVPCVGLVCNPTGSHLSEIGGAGAGKILTIACDGEQAKSSEFLIVALEQGVKKEGSKVVILICDHLGKALGPELSGRLRGGLVSGVVSDPEIENGKFMVKKNVFSGKAVAVCEIHSEIKIVSLTPNSFPVVSGDGVAVAESFVVDLGGKSPKVVVKETISNVSGNMVPLPEAELVVSAGRGMKGPENWGIIEDLAKAIGATTACSRPVADMHWRPHHEHVGQTGIAIRPNLYIAIGISGAIQHLAGVNGSKTIVVINSDKEAPFFKSADYGIVGDAFEVVPKLTEAIKKIKSAN